MYENISRDEEMESLNIHIPDKYHQESNLDKAIRCMLMDCGDDIYYNGNNTGKSKADMVILDETHIDNHRLYDKLCGIVEYDIQK